ncbi:MAG: NB-ARC domain-containing protein [Pseudomonadales bacterium]
MESTIIKPPNAPFMAPPDIPEVVARSNELNKLKSMILGKSEKSVVVCSITGCGGTGKSTLAAHFAHRCRHHFPDGIFWVNVESETPIIVAQKIASVLGKGIVDVKNESHAQTIINKLMLDKKALLVLDNADGRYASRRIENIRPGGTDVAVLITTRNQAVSGAQGAEKLNLDFFKADDGVTFFQKIMGNDSRYSMSISVVQKIVNSLGGMPLAIELAATMFSRKKSLTLDQYMNGMKIENLEVDGTSVFSSLYKSFGLLDSFEQKALISLRVCATSGFSVDEAMTVSKINDRNRIRKLLSNKLYPMSLVQRLPPQRFVLHPVILAFLRAQ